ncbi:hypothetical protein IFT48_01675 [Pseudomonas fluorescens]|uniref:hypothetical protein n=2 Tax=Pseudomonas TaxID=286 RepID=UPI000F01ADA4|nr:hypothetical protein [Pseudomonas fluorescens]MBD8088671.1 hypothetical protein [Pseudomonas fluorescens]MBD8614868.1 hypothetical protein [Pseudomonas putida]MBD8681448.1 hypothetical protein [Pseudomonas sp. CFBP 13719]
MNHLSRVINTALLRKDDVAIFGTVFTYRDKGDTWDCGDETLEALNSGIYVKATVTRGGEEIGSRYLWQSPLDELPRLLKMACSEMTVEQLDELRVEVGATNVLKTLYKKRELPSESLAP